FHEHWCYGNDPYLEVYRMEKQFVGEVFNYVADLWNKSKLTPTFYELEDRFGKERRAHLIDILRYCYLAGSFDKGVYDQLLKATEHTVEASGLCEPFSDADLQLV